MNNLLLNHPYKHGGEIVIPIRLEKRLSNPTVIYIVAGEEEEREMWIGIWNEYCEPVCFEEKEGA